MRRNLRFVIPVVATLFFSAANGSRASAQSSDKVPPKPPTLSAKQIGVTYVILTWSWTGNGPNVWYWVFMDGVAVLQGTRDTSGTIIPIEPSTTHTFVVRARDVDGNWSPISEPLSLTTNAPNPNDHMPPTRPTDVSGKRVGDGSTEIDLTWKQSTDDLEPQWAIKYNVYVNGALTDTVVGTGRSIIYGTFGSNTVTVEAVDSAGNKSGPVTIMVVI